MDDPRRTASGRVADAVCTPVDVRFDKNLIYLVFHKEVQVLKFMTL